MDGCKLAISFKAFQREYRGMSGRDFWGLLARFLGLSPPSTFKGFGSKHFLRHPDSYPDAERAKQALKWNYLIQ